MIRVLHILHSMNRGGAETMLMNYYRHIDRQQVQFDFLLTCPTHCQYEDEILELGGRVFRVPLISVRNPFKYMQAVLRFFKEHPEYQIVHSHTSSKSSIPLYIAKRCNIPVRICHAHNNHSESGLSGCIRDLLKHPLRAVATDFFACSCEASDWLYGQDISKSGKVRLLKNAIEINFFARQKEVRAQVREELGIKEEDLVAGMVARFCYQKNHLFALDILSKLLTLNPKAKLLLVGDGELRPDIEKKIDALHLQDNVIMTGIVSHVERYMQAMDVLLMPSFNEGLPVSLVEAQAAGLPCLVSTNVPKESDIAGNMKFLSLEEGASRWAKEIISLDTHTNNDGIQKMRDAGYDIHSEAKKLQDWYIERTHEIV